MKGEGGRKRVRKKEREPKTISQLLGSGLITALKSH